VLAALPRISVASAVTALVIVAAGCGHGTRTAGVASLGNATTNASSGIAAAPTLADKVAASRCMRAHGVPNFPDPITINGKKYFGFTVSSGVKNTPTFQAAYKLCGTKYLGLSHRSTPAQRALWHAEAIRYTACMRSHGVKDFPDPEQGDGAIDVRTATYLQTPDVERGQQACKPLLKSVVFVVPW